MAFFDIIEEQISIAFTGRVNVLSRETHRYLGVIYLDSGAIVGANFNELLGKRALYQIIYDANNNEDDFTFVVEPEVIDSGLFSFSLGFKELQIEWLEFKRQYDNSKKFIPPKDLRLLVKDSFIESGDPVTLNEFKVLTLITQTSDVVELYSKASLHEYEVTAALVSLRKKGALTVLKGELPTE